MPLSGANYGATCLSYLQMSFDINYNSQTICRELWYGNSNKKCVTHVECSVLTENSLLAGYCFHRRLIRPERIIIRKYTSWLSAIILGVKQRLMEVSGTILFT
jgi:hypothetical protein